MIRRISRKPLPGDIVVAVRVCYKHYGIYIGNNQVIHFAGEEGREKDPRYAKVTKTSFAEFQKKSRVFVEETTDYIAFPAEQVIAMAKARLGEKGYNILINNCEHFANECKYGVRRSRQVEDTLKETAMLTCVVIITVCPPARGVMTLRSLYKAVA